MLTSPDMGEISEKEGGIGDGQVSGTPGKCVVAFYLTRQGSQSTSALRGEP